MLGSEWLTEFIIHVCTSLCFPPNIDCMLYIRPDKTKKLLCRFISFFISFRHFSRDSFDLTAIDNYYCNDYCDLWFSEPTCLHCVIRVRWEFLCYFLASGNVRQTIKYLWPAASNFSSATATVREGALDGCRWLNNSFFTCCSQVDIKWNRKRKSHFQSNLQSSSSSAGNLKLFLSIFGVLNWNFVVKFRWTRLPVCQPPSNAVHLSSSFWFILLLVLHHNSVIRLWSGPRPVFGFPFNIRWLILPLMHLL